MKGLLGKKGLEPGEALILKPCNSVHTFFMRFPIDILFVDINNRVVGMNNSLKPNRLSRIYLNARLTIELPAGFINSSQTSLGDTLEFRDTP